MTKERTKLFIQCIFIDARTLHPSFLYVHTWRQLLYPENAWAPFARFGVIMIVVSTFIGECVRKRDKKKNNISLYLSHGRTDRNSNFQFLRRHFLNSPRDGFCTSFLNFAVFAGRRKYFSLSLHIEAFSTAVWLQAFPAKGSSYSLRRLNHNR